MAEWLGEADDLIPIPIPMEQAGEHLVQTTPSRTRAVRGSAEQLKCRELRVGPDVASRGPTSGCSDVRDL
jgi:hypothetical protein